MNKPVEPFYGNRHLPERYFVQLGLYRLAIREALAIEPELRLVHLQHGKVTRLEAGLVEAAVEEVPREAARS
jgi:hypothetical protein